MPLALGSLDRVVPGREGESVSSVETQGHPAGPEGGEQARGGSEQTRPEFERVTDVLGPLEQIVLAADQQIGSIQEQVDEESGEASTRIERRVREAALEQRGRVVKMREELTDAASRLATRFETMLDILDQAERQLSRQGLPEGEANGGREMRVTLTERRRVTISHEGPPSTAQQDSAPPPMIAAGKEVEPGKPGKEVEPGKRKGIRGWFRRRRGSAA